MNISPGAMQPPQGQPPVDLSAILASLGGGGAPQDGQEQENAQENAQPGDWLVEAINAVHEGMVEEQDPQIVSQIAKVQDLLTTIQAILAKGSQQQSA